MDLNRGTITALLVAASAAGAGATWIATRDSGPSASLEAAAPIATATPAATPGVTAADDAPFPATAAPAPATAARGGRQALAAPQAQPRGPSRDVSPAPVANPSPWKAAAAEAEPAPILPAPAPAIVVGEAAPVVTEPEFEELLVPAGMVMGLQLDVPLSSEEAQVEQRVEGRITRDVRVSDRVAIPAGSRIIGEVTAVERGGRLRERARLEIRFTAIELADGTRLGIDTAPLVREGDAPARESTAKIGGGALGGAIIGGILGGARGAVLGGSAGAAAGTGLVLAGGRNAAVVPAGTPLTVRLTSPASVLVDR